MDATVTALVASACMIGGAIFGSLLRWCLPEHHLNEHAKDVIRLGCGLITTIAALTIAFLISSAKMAYESDRSEIRHFAANVILLDRVLDRYGPEARQARLMLRKAIDPSVHQIWRDAAHRKREQETFQTSPHGDAAHDAILNLIPQTDSQRTYHLQAMQLVAAIVRSRLVLFEQTDDRLPLPFLVLLVFWLTLLFASFSLFSPLNLTTMAAIVLVAISAGGAIFLVLEMNEPFSGLMQIPAERLKHLLPPVS